jgi:hypothetical protein
MQHVRKQLITLLLLCLFPTSSFALTLEFADNYRDTNDVGQRLGLSDGKGRFNKQDCSEKDTLHFYFNINITEEDQAGDFTVALYAGTGCETASSDSPTCKSTVLDFTGNRRVGITISQLFGADFVCSGTGEINIWASRGTGVDGIWLDWDYETDPLTIAYDLESPETPTLESALPGDSKVGVSWSGTDGGDSIYILYYPGSHSTMTDQPTDENSTDMTSTDIGSSDGDAGDGPDAGAGTSPRMMNFAPSFAASTATTDTESQSCPSPDGGFSAGDVFVDPSVESDYGLQTGNKGGDAEVAGLTNDKPYKFGLVTKDSYNNYSKVSNTMCATPGETTNFWTDYTDAGGKGGKFCFIATAAFGSYNHPVVQMLRMFRDRFLAALPGGNQVIAAYYRVGPSMARAVENHPTLRAVTVGILTAAAGLSIPLSILGPLGTLSFLVLISGTFIIRKRIRRREI